MQRRGTLLVVSGPSGAGKGTLCSKLLANRSHVQFSVSVTTRKPRNGEVDGVHYNFVSDERFDEMIEAGEFLEYACIFGLNRYGTPIKGVEELLKKGVDVLLDIDVQGAMNVKKIMAEAVLVFVLPPSYEVLAHRLRNRGTEDEEMVVRRLNTAREEIKLADRYDYLVVNDDLKTATEQLIAILTAERCRKERSYASVMKNWEEQL